MTTFTASFAAVAVTAAQDVFELTAHASTRLRIRDIKIGQYSDFGDAAAEILSVRLIRGHTVAGSGGSAVTPVNLQPWSRAAVSTVVVNNTTIASGGTSKDILADVMNVAAGWSLRDCFQNKKEGGLYDPHGIWVEKSGILVLRITAPADSLTMNGTIVFEEDGF